MVLRRHFKTISNKEKANNGISRAKTSAKGQLRM